jgi:hypothetical protein
MPERREKVNVYSDTKALTGYKAAAQTVFDPRQPAASATLAAGWRARIRGLTLGLPSLPEFVYCTV